MNSVRHTWRQQISTNKNEEKENSSMQEPNRKLLGFPLEKIDDRKILQERVASLFSTGQRRSFFPRRRRQKRPNALFKIDEDFRSYIGALSYGLTGSVPLQGCET
jgi:hypothetical protein